MPKNTKIRLKEGMGKKYKIKCIEHEVEQQELAEKMGINQYSLSHIINGTRNPSAEMAKTIADHTPWFDWDELFEIVDKEGRVIS